MLRKTLPIILILALFAFGCSKKNQPQTSIKVTDYPSSASGTPTVSKDSAAVANKTAERKAVKRVVPKTAVAKVITVDDRAAHATAEGRMYYDLEGKRYWKNFKDGKYYLYRTNMFSDPAFKPQ